MGRGDDGESRHVTVAEGTGRVKDIGGGGWRGPHVTGRAGPTCPVPRVLPKFLPGKRRNCLFAMPGHATPLSMSS